MRALLDTCAISELISKTPNQNALDFIASIDERKLYLSVITIGEIKSGISVLKDKKKKERLLEWLYDDLLIRFGGRILNIEANTMLIWGEMVGANKLKGRSLSVMDSLIAAQCKEHKLSLITRNEDDFASLGINILNQWN